MNQYTAGIHTLRSDVALGGDTQCKLAKNVYYAVVLRHKFGQSLAQLVAEMEGVFCFDEADLSGSVFILRGNDSAALADLYTCFIQWARKVVPGAELSISALLHGPQAIAGAVETLRRDANMHGAVSDATLYLVAEVKRYIKEHFQEPDLSVASIARSFHLTPSYFSSLFAKSTGMSAVKYITRQRVGYAARELLNSHKSIEAISEEAGFTSPTYFYKVFKKQMNVTPSEYQRYSGQNP